MFNPEQCRGLAARYLRQLADGIEAGHILECEVEWEGGAKITGKTRLAKPLDFVLLREELCDFILLTQEEAKDDERQG